MDISFEPHVASAALLLSTERTIVNSLSPPSTDLPNRYWPHVDHLGRLTLNAVAADRCTALLPAQCVAALPFESCGGSCLFCGRMTLGPEAPTVTLLLTVACTQAIQFEIKTRDRDAQRAHLVDGSLVSCFAVAPPRVTCDAAGAISGSSPARTILCYLCSWSIHCTPFARSNACFTVL